MAPGLKCPRLFIDPMINGKFANHPDWNKFAQLIDYNRTMLGWF